MNVYIAVEHWWNNEDYDASDGGTNIFGVFSNLDKAKEAIKKKLNNIKNIGGYGLFKIVETNDDETDIELEYGDPEDPGDPTEYGGRLLIVTIELDKAYLEGIDQG